MASQQAVESRRAQGLPAQVEDVSVLARLADLVGPTVAASSAGEAVQGEGVADVAGGTGAVGLTRKNASAAGVGPVAAEAS